MADSTNTLATILHECAAAAPEPWYPSAYARAKGIDRDSLDPFLDRLRMGGLIQLTDWVQGTGQGYILTPEGQHVINSPRELDKVRDGRMPDRRPVPAGPPVHEGALSPWERGEVIRAALMDPEPARLTRILIYLNIAVFLVGLVLAGQKGLVSPYLSGFDRTGKVWGIQQQLGALSGMDLVRGEWWKLLTACFVHLGLLHLGFNMYSLYVIGPAVEQMYGRWRFLVIYLISGLGGSIAMAWQHPDQGGAGASGALWGIMTAYAMWIFLNRGYLPGPLNPAFMRNLLSVFLLNVFISMMPGISAAAHFGGGAVGAVTGWLVNTERFSQGVKRWAAAAGIVLLPLTCLGLLARDMQTNHRWLLLAAQERQRERGRETDAFESEYLPRIQQTMKTAEKIYRDQVEPVTNQHPDRRDAAKAKEALLATANEQGELAGLVQWLDRAPAFTDPDVEEARQRGRAFAQAGVDLFQQAQRALQAGDDWKKEDEKLESVRIKFLELRKQWLALLAP